MIGASTQIHLVVARARCDGDLNFPFPFRYHLCETTLITAWWKRRASQSRRIAGLLPVPCRGRPCAAREAADRPRIPSGRALFAQREHSPVPNDNERREDSDSVPGTHILRNGLVICVLVGVEIAQLHMRFGPLSGRA